MALIYLTVNDLLFPMISCRTDMPHDGWIAVLCVNATSRAHIKIASKCLFYYYYKDYI